MNTPVRVIRSIGTEITLNLEDYLKGVVPVEISTGFPLEALKAQAIAARSFAIANKVHGIEDGPCVTADCQIWRDRRFADTDRAVDETRGVVVTIQGKVVPTYYFAHCDGHTRNSEEVWGGRLEYCRSVPCPCGFQALHGHGVGLCQEGAIVLARQGNTAEQIIHHYFQGIKLTQLNGQPTPRKPDCLPTAILSIIIVSIGLWFALRLSP